MNKTPDTFLIVDGHSLAFRAFFAFPETLTLKNGLPVNAIFGFVSLLFNTIDRYKPTYLCVCFDRKEPTFRHVQYEAYKAHRPAAPPPFIAQMQQLGPLLAQLGIFYLDKAGFEADDLMGTLAKLGEEKGLQVRIMTGDHDALQLVTQAIWVVMNKKSEFVEYTPALVEETYGFLPPKMVDYKALRGDSSDNIPGVPGIGEKTAVALLQKYGDLASVYAHVDEVMPNGVRLKLQEGAHLAELSWFLAKINTEVELDLEWDRLRFQPDWPTIVASFEAFEFNRLAQKYRGRILSDEPMPLLKTVEDSPVLELTTFQTKLHFLKSGFGICLGVDRPEYLGISAGDSFSCQVLVSDALWTALAPLLLDGTVSKWVIDSKTLLHAVPDFILSGMQFVDVQLAGYLLKGKSDFQTMADFVGLQLDKPDIDAGQLACLAFRVSESVLSEIQAFGMERLLFDIELPLIKVLVGMEKTGIKVDLAVLEMLRSTFETRLQKVKQDCVFQAGVDFNLNSPKQLADVLFEHLKLPVIKKTKTGFSTDSSVLEKLVVHHPIASLLLTYRQLDKLLSTYVRALPEMVSPSSGRIHTTYNQMGAATGRLSSINPNLQNIPIRTPEGLDIRGAFVASASDRVLLSVDYSQIELRVLAHVCQDAQMIAAFKRGDDIHKSTAAKVYGISLDAVTKEQRYSAKAVNFGIIYGMSSFGLSEALSIPPSEAKEIIDKYFEMFPAIQSFVSKTIELAKTTGYVTTEFGRIRFIPELKASSFVQRQFGERAAVNTRIQGTAADLMKLAMVKISEDLSTRFPSAQLLLQVHDELVFDVLESEAKVVSDWVSAQMRQVVNWSVPLEVDVAWGKNWKEISI